MIYTKEKKKFRPSFFMKEKKAQCEWCETCDWQILALRQLSPFSFFFFLFCSQFYLIRTTHKYCKCGDGNTALFLS